MAVLTEGTVRFLDAGASAPKVIAFERTLGDARLVTVCSFDENGCRVDGIDLADMEMRIGNYDDAALPGEDGALALRPFEAVVFTSGC
ncbi:alpha-glucosidase C-terminal domain-containing protein [Collinsella tanakaei]|uniref:alpha-glucosidase C-terminal domain-containing protein n=1 Tax=Collinsella tanakaei TaxID=626935 RepID=UPI001EF75261|nr:alpha-glucosidase C-terminal domain-containing protein [Collinsella tanakaei]